MAISPDGKRVAVGCQEESLHLFAVDTGRKLKSPDLKGHISAVEHLTFSPDGTMLALSNYSRVMVWDLSKGEAATPYLHHDQEIKTVQFSIDGKKFVTAGADKTARIWESTGGKPIGRPLENPMGIRSAVFSPDGKRIATACGDDKVRIWDAATGEPTRALLDCGPQLNAVAFDTKGERIATSNWNKPGSVWDLATSKRIVTLKLKDSIISGRVCFSPDGTLVALHTGDGVRVLDARTGEEVR